jgi:endonuclease/exonuclease/phosphatase family metal-dependent hydrolase
MSPIRHWVIFPVLLNFAFFIMKSNAQIPMRLLTHNIRYATSSPFTGEKPWADRKQLILNELYFNTLYSPEAFICLQEVLHQQLLDVMGGLDKLSPGEWDRIGVGRDDGKEAGEYSPILFRSGIWKLEKFQTVWLSQTPDKPSKGWDAASVRILTVGVFQHRQSKKSIVALNTHLDDQGEKSRQESAKLILDTITKTASAGNGSDSLPVFLAGDLNSDRSGSAYKLLTAASSSLEDTNGLAAVKYGDKSTFTGFEGKSRTEIDHVFVGPKAAKPWGVKAYAVLANRFEDGVYNSDHRAVVADVVLVKA